MIVKGGGGLILIFTMKAGVDSAVLENLKMGYNLLLKMNTEAMDNTIAFCMGLKVTFPKRTRKGRRCGIL